MQSPAPVFEPLGPGDPREIGGYRISARLGAGGMGRVYLGTTRSGRRLAVKVIRPDLADDPEFRRRFQREIAAAERVQSMFAAPVIDADPHGAVPWLATTYVPGPSLDRVLVESGPLPLSTVRTLVGGIAQALRDIHAAGVIHRDLKPSNVVLAPDGPRVIDFGIAWAGDATPLTRTGVRIGSPQFMAPEQALGQESTPAIDVFALGCLAYFAATGRSAFGEGPDAAVLFRIAHEDPSLDRCPDELRPLIARCLARDPAQRPDPAEIVAELQADTVSSADGWLPDALTQAIRTYSTPPPPPPPAAPPVPSKSRRARPLDKAILAVAAGSVVVAALVVAITAGHSPDDRADSPSGDGPLVTDGASPGSTHASSLSPPPLRPVYLTDLNPVNEPEGDEDSSVWDNGEVTIDGHTYQRGMIASIDCSEEVREYSLNGHYQHFHATMGLADNTPDPSPITLKISGNGAPLRSVNLRIAHPITVDLDIHGLIRLSLNLGSPKYCGDEGDSKVGIGDPQLLP